MTQTSTRSQIEQSGELAHLTLGKEVTYEENYNPKLLQAVSRELGRNAIGLQKLLPFSGDDLWNGYEFSWLNEKGKPNVAILECRVPVTSPNLIESKSFKMYLNSFNQTRFATLEEVVEKLKQDLSGCAGETVNVQIAPVASLSSQQQIAQLPGECIDDQDVTISSYQPDSQLLQTDSEIVTETLHSHLLKSNCLITGQPDWASVLIKYKGPKIQREGLLKYLVGFRQHNEFHEQCVERIFNDILNTCEPESLTVLARYTRRGGLDINPFRSNFEAPYENLRLIRQ
ncbi:NADPH-dependent 7-cyano-7-deazaguanine reductase QueF [Paraneptunicella aestuarii]|uniref:NADPH-dependent 7-cyano-7-deazaguanine reductase QueF n=1 Tax=Paraneptunicella aestuarii TaxID=2831148 RepID=UPI001E456C81|nr:NADPH-dependent 7-cyano-7-deazaguanine reductase QueF [Paraneptunicella aestuarii]UAA39694.1 NADPH-dependent 7-cyano-7-deazaguanine reductase QueF [Paraneptunicella aestuarii]